MNPTRWLFPTLVACCVSLSVAHAATPLMVEKNLFSQDRKPSSGETQPTASPTGPVVPPKTIQLDGIMVRGNQRKALLRLKANPGPKDKGKKDSPFTTVGEGERIQDYTVTKIGTRSVFLEKGGQVFEVFLYAEGKVLPPLAATPPAGPPGAPGQPGQPHGVPQPQGGGPETGMEAEGIPGAQQGLNDPNVAANRRQRAARRVAVPPVESPEPEEIEEEEGLEDAGQ